LDDNVNINRTWESIRDNFKLSAKGSPSCEMLQQ